MRPRTDDASQVRRPLAWRLLAEFSPSLATASEYDVAERVLVAARELGLGLEQMERVREAIAEAVRDTTTRRDLAQASPSVSIRIWVASACAQDPSQSGPHEHRSWGFFLVQKHGQDRQASDVAPPQVIEAIELFLYHEGALAR